MIKGKKVLLLEKKASIWMPLGCYLENSCGLKVNVIRNLEELIPALQSTIYDVMISDTNFPKWENIDDTYFDRKLWGGLECERFIVPEVEKAQHDLPIIFYTSKRFDESLKNTMRESDVYIRKPVHITEIAEKIRTILSAKKQH